MCDEMAFRIESSDNFRTKEKNQKNLEKSEGLECNFRVYVSDTIYCTLGEFVDNDLCR